MKTSLYVAALCVSTALSPVAFAQTGSGQQQTGQSQQQMGQRSMGQQQSQQPMNQQVGQRLTEQNIRQFFGDVQQVLQRTARTQDPAALRQYLNQYLDPDAQITTSSELYLGDRHVATTIAHATEETVTDALGHAASALQGRKLVSDYNIDMRVRDIQMMPGQQSARVAVVIQESGNFGGPIANRVAERMRDRMMGSQQSGGGWGRQQQGSMGMQQQQQGSMSGTAQSSSDDSQQQQERSLGIGSGQGRGGGTDQQGMHFENRSTCLIDVGLEDGQMRIGNTFCRSMMRLG
ncbi:hypothetical protein ACO2I3_11710 [Leptospira interrogans]